MSKYYYVYIVASSKNGTLYIGVTNNLVSRIWQHKNKTYKGFTQKYHADKLVHYEIFEDINEAIDREKKIKILEKRMENSINRKQQSHLGRFI